MRSLQGRFLVACPRLLDPNFFRTVVFMIQHNDEGGLGVVVNRPLPDTVRDLWDQVCGEDCDNDDRVYWGGPVNGPVLMLHTDVTASQDEIMPGLFLAADRAQLAAVLGQDEHPSRIFVGYSGWAPGQLESEIRDGSWLVLQGDKSLIFSDDEELWERSIAQLGVAALAPMLKSAPIPKDPSCN